jgi:branched-chain amino acid transport system substrate-binding protein
LKALVTWLAAGALLLFAVFGTACSSNDNDSGSKETGSIRIGALLPLSGSLSSYGETSKAALDDAVATINKKSGARKVDLVVEDTTTDPKVALEKLQSLHGRGIKVIIGPYASSEVNGVKDFANQNGIILISPLSTARTLAVPNDNILRFTPDDEQEGVAVAALAWADGVKVILPVSRNDEGNLGLQTAMKPAFEKLGGRVLPAVTYGANEQDFPAVVRNIESGVAGAGASGKEFGIYLTAFGEVTKLFGATSGVASLQQVVWYGSDSVALSKDLVEDAVAADFAIAAKYPNPILGLRESDKSVWGPVSDRLTKDLGRTPDAFALAAYDALNVAHAAVAKVGSTAGAPALRDEIVRLSSTTTGLTGPLVLNAAGDREIGNYDFWAVCKRNNQLTWVRVHTYTASATGNGTVAKTADC